MVSVQIMERDKGTICSVSSRGMQMRRLVKRSENMITNKCIRADMEKPGIRLIAPLLFTYYTSRG